MCGNWVLSNPVAIVLTSCHSLLCNFTVSFENPVQVTTVVMYVCYYYARPTNSE